MIGVQILGPRSAQALPDIPELWQKQHRQGEDRDKVGSDDGNIECRQVYIEGEELGHYDNDCEKEHVAKKTGHEKIDSVNTYHIEPMGRLI